jgi:opacity protein-like surface antigen
MELAFPRNGALMPSMRSIFLLFCVAFLAATVSVDAQVQAAARGRQSRLSVGAFGSAFQPDYTGHGFAGPSPNPLIGIGAYFDYRINHYIGIEGEGNWMHFNQYNSISENTYLIGPKVYIHELGKFDPYGKFLIGAGNGSFLNGNTTVLAYGGGVDYNLSPHWVVRVGDFEFQQWRVTPRLYPYGGSFGVAYKIF